MTEKKQNAPGGAKVGKFRRVVSTVIFILVVTCAVLMFLPDGFCPEANSAVSESANDYLQYCCASRNSEMFSFLHKKYGDLSEVKISCEEMHYLFNNRFLTNEAINLDAVWEIKGINFTPAGDDEVKVTLYTKLANVIPASFTVVGEVGKGKSSVKPIAFKVKSARMGYLPFFGKSSKFVTDKFAPLVRCLPELSTAFIRSNSVEFDDGNFVFELKK